MPPRRTIILCILCLLISIASAEEQVYVAPDAFLKDVFGAVPKPGVLWVTPAIQADVTRIMGRPPAKLRERYWADGAKTAWILEEIGKEELITAGFVVANGKLERARVLVYRESRGMEVRYPAFLTQFDGAALTQDNQLTKRIDGISGATLSVWAMGKMARQALYYDRMVQAK